MRVISKSRLRQFWETPGRADAEGPLRAWYAHVGHRATAWRTWADVKASLGSASRVGNCTVFNIGGNKYRLIVRVLYASQKVFVLRVLTHEEYDRLDWAGECGCHDLPPRPKGRPAGPPRQPRPRRRG